MRGPRAASRLTALDPLDRAKRIDAGFGHRQRRLRPGALHRLRFLRLRLLLLDPVETLLDMQQTRERADHQTRQRIELVAAAP
jgi:hypothetical protein